MPVPAVAHGRFGAVLRLRTVGKLGTITLGVRMDAYGQLAGAVGKRNFHTGKHALVAALHNAVNQNIKGVVDALGYKNGGLAILAFVSKLRAVFPCVAFGLFKLLYVFAVVDIASAHHAAIVVLHIAGYAGRKPFGCAVFTDGARLPKLAELHMYKLLSDAGIVCAFGWV